jgi:hypothetical protein
VKKLDVIAQNQNHFRHRRSFHFYRSVLSAHSFFYQLFNFVTKPIRKIGIGFVFSSLHYQKKLQIAGELELLKSRKYSSGLFTKLPTPIVNFTQVSSNSKLRSIN